MKILAFGLILGLLAALFIGSVKAQEHRHPVEHQSLHEKFYRDWMMPDNRSISCCHDEDCKPAQSRQLNGKWQARHSDADEWSDVPAYKIETERDSPDGQSHLCGGRLGTGLLFIAFCRRRGVEWVKCVDL
jgi:hypothetical protein